jgi:dGTPase|tara:strand:- start:8583 stop:9671 length:1089 start_codon:yes stop_codon:yes gene_type:complete
MNISKISEFFFKQSAINDSLLSCFAVKEANSSREFSEIKENLYRNSFQIDRDRIIHTNSFRRLKHKSQVFVAPIGDHYTTRLTHVIEVSQIGRTIARSLKLNEDLVEAASLGHDLGHTPFGHIGETVLNEILDDGFHHSKHSIKIINKLEKNGKGLNLTNFVIDAIERHSKGQGEFLNSKSVKGMTLEAQIVRISDALAYLSHDIQDAKRSGFIKSKNIKGDIREFFNMEASKRINEFVTDVIVNSWDCNGDKQTSKIPIIKMSKDFSVRLIALRNFMFENFYLPVSDSVQGKTASKIVSTLFDYYYNNFEKIPKESRFKLDLNDRATSISDYICGMTDQFAVREVEKISPGISKTLNLKKI